MAASAMTLETVIATGIGFTLRPTEPSPASPRRDTMRDQAVANVTHDLRAPLSALSITLELLEDPSAHTIDELKHLLDSMRRSVVWMDGLVGNLATSAALDQDRITLSREVVPVVQCIERAVSIIQPLLDRRGQVVNVSCPTEYTVVSVDTIRIGQVIVNLLANASAYGGWGEPISVTVSVSSDEVQIMVSDCGPGMSNDEQRRVFNRGMRGVRGLESGANGQGLGLSIVRSLVEMHGGEVGVSSVLGKGSSFWFTLPCTAAVQPGAQIAGWMQRCA